MSIGLFWNDRISFDKHERKMKFFYVGNNTGNLVFIRALKNIFRPEIIPLWDVDSGAFHDRDSIDAYVTTELIWLTAGTTYPHVWKMLREIGDKPLVPISVGIHGPRDVKLHPDTIRLLRTLSERAVLGVRGEYTASILEKLGVLNLQIIGCPSLYYGMNDSFRLEKPPFHKDMRTTVNFRTFYGKLEPKECEFLTYAANHRFDFVEQTQQVLELSHCQNNVPQYEYFSRWLDERSRVFFEIDPWVEWLKGYDFSMGSRFHGNVLAITGGIPALTMAIDGRMQEMTQLFRLPTLSVEEFSMNRPLEWYYDKADFTEFNRVYPQRLADFREFLRRNGLQEAVRQD